MPLNTTVENITYSMYCEEKTYNSLSICSGCCMLIYCFTNTALPTGALDSRATDGLLKLFSQINAEGQTVVMVTHSTKAASHANRILFIKDGEVFHQIYRGNATNEQLYVKISDALTVLTTGGEEHE